MSQSNLASCRHSIRGRVSHLPKVSPVLSKLILTDSHGRSILYHMCLASSHLSFRGKKGDTEIIHLAKVREQEAVMNA